MPDIQTILAWLGGILTATIITKNIYDFILNLLGRKRSVKKEDLDIAQKFEELTRSALESKEQIEKKFNDEHQLVLSVQDELQAIKNATAFRMSMTVFPYIPAITDVNVNPIVPGANINVLVTSGDSKTKPLKREVRLNSRQEEVSGKVEPTSGTDSPPSTEKSK